MKGSAPADGEERLRLRMHGGPEARRVVYLPGIHGDWTLIGGLRERLAGRVLFAECTYPRTTTWTLDDYAHAIASALVSAGVDDGWILAESFGSQVAWPIAAGDTSFRAQGLILAGGFGRYPLPRLPALCALVARGVPMKAWRMVFRLYPWIARWRFRDSPALQADLPEFIARRTEADRRAVVHRLRLIARNDPAPWVRRTCVPVHYLTGLLDPVVPWPFIPRSLSRNCPGFRGWKMIRTADHNVLASGARDAAPQILSWMQAATASARDP